ncbi:Glucan endo-1 [Psidium guajava]|nr:Glucan endo-1 [Psidium guajava]
MMVDAVIAAMAVAGHENIPVIVAETGWPNSSPDATEIDANELYSEMYVKGLLGHLRSGQGTPLRKEGAAEAYVYELVDEEANGTTSQARARNWGILYANFSEKYEVQFSCASYCESSSELLIGFVVMLLILVWLIWYVPNSPW